MTPDERRLAIIEAVAPLLVDHGATVTTKQMAEAAGIAEGTLFSVFPDKRSVILATIKQRMDPEPLRNALAAAAAHGSLEEQLEAASAYVLRCVSEMGALGNVLHTLPHATGDKGPHGRPGFMKAWGMAATEGIAALLEPHAARFRMPPERIAGVFLGLLFASRWRADEPARSLDSRDAIDIFLYGVASKEGD